MSIRYIQSYQRQMQKNLMVLGYWNQRGLVEKNRQLLQYCGLPYSQNIYVRPGNNDQWWKVDRPKLIDQHPALNLPFLTDGHKVISESDAICIYICHRGNKIELLGRNTDEMVLLATVNGVFKDVHRAYFDLTYGKYNDESQFQEAVKSAITSFQPSLKKLNGLLGTKSFMAGQLTWVDFGVADFIQTLGLLNKDFTKDFPKLEEYQRRVWALPELKDYFASERFKERPCNGGAAYWK